MTRKYLDAAPFGTCASQQAPTSDRLSRLAPLSYLRRGLRISSSLPRYMPSSRTLLQAFTAHTQAPLLLIISPAQRSGSAPPALPLHQRHRPLSHHLWRCGYPSRKASLTDQSLDILAASFLLSWSPFLWPPSKHC